MDKKNIPTLQDVAQLAGVSTASISRALNDPDKVALKTRERIEAAVQELGYTPNFGGKALASNRSGTIGAIIPTMANAMFASGLQAFQEVLSEAGMTMLIASSGYDPEHEKRQIQTLISRGIDGLLLIGDERPKETIDFLKKRNIPYVISWCYRATGDHTYVGFNNEKAAYDITQRVLELGHRKIAMISGITEGNDRARYRVDGVKKAIKKYGQKAKLVKVVESKYLIAHGSEAFERINDLPELPTAIICGNDVLAAGAIKQAKFHGYEIPQDISITGFDDIGVASVVDPALTTVRVPQIEMGRAAAKVILDKVNGKKNVGNIELPTEVITRDSLITPI